MKTLLIVVALTLGILLGGLVVADEACASYNCTTETYTITYNGPPYFKVITCQTCCFCTTYSCNCTRNCY